MTSNPLNMLKMLGRTGAGPTIAPGVPGGRPDITKAGFADLLKMARAGEMSSGREVSIDPGVKADLTSEQKTALASAADRAEAAGLNRALVIVNGQGFVLDVASRSVTATADLSNPSVLSQIDGVVNAGTGELGRAALAMPPSGLVGNSTLAQVLSRGAEGSSGKR